MAEVKYLGTTKTDLYKGSFSLPWTFTLKMPAEMFAKTLEHLQHTMPLNPDRQSYMF
jgi:hypothetical protein